MAWPCGEELGCHLMVQPHYLEFGTATQLVVASEQELELFRRQPLHAGAAAVWVSFAPQQYNNNRRRPAWASSGRGFDKFRVRRVNKKKRAEEVVELKRNQLRRFYSCRSRFLPLWCPSYREGDWHRNHRRAFPLPNPAVCECRCQISSRS